VQSVEQHAKQRNYCMLFNTNPCTRRGQILFVVLL
jgi:hypothetical protein